MKHLFIWFTLLSINLTTSIAEEIKHSQNCPINCSACSTAIEKAMGYIVGQQKDSGEIKAQKYASAIHTALGGLVFLSQGSTLSEGKYQKNIKKCKFYLDKWEQNDKATYAAWKLIYVVLFYTQLQTLSPKDHTKKRLQKLVQRLIAIKHPKGGWAHVYNPNRPAVYPYSFPTATILGLWGLYQAKKLGVVIDDKVFSSALDHLKNATNKEGCIEHGPGIGEDSFNVAKTAAGLGIAQLIRRNKDLAWIKRMEQYVKKHMPQYKGIDDEHSQVEITYPFAAIALEQMNKRKWLVNLRQALVAQQDGEGAWRIPPRRRGGNWFEGKFMITAGHVILLLSHKNRLAFAKSSK